MKLMVIICRFLCSLLLIGACSSQAKATVTESLLLVPDHRRLGKNLEDNMENLTETAFDKVDELVDEEVPADTEKFGSDSSFTEE